MPNTTPRARQGFIEGRIAELEGTLSNAHLIDPSSLDAEGRAVFGATVDIEDLDSGDRLTYQIVGDVEADIKSNLISVSSPVARALIGKSEGDVVEVLAPAGVRSMKSWACVTSDAAAHLAVDHQNTIG